VNGRCIRDNLPRGASGPTRTQLIKEVAAAAVAFCDARASDLSNPSNENLRQATDCEADLTACTRAYRRRLSAPAESRA
jgi:hypothetical protein